MRIADWRVMPAAGLLLAFGCAGEGTMPRPAPRVMPRPAPSGVPRPSTSEVSPPSHETGEELDAIWAAKLRASSAAAAPGEPARWAGPFRRTTPAGSVRRPPYEPVAGIALGAGWGCAELEATGQRSRACWLPPAAAERDGGKPVVRANRVPYITPAGWLLRDPKLCSPE